MKVDVFAIEVFKADKDFKIIGCEGVVTKLWDNQFVAIDSVEKSFNEVNKNCSRSPKIGNHFLRGVVKAYSVDFVFVIDNGVAQDEVIFVFHLAAIGEDHPGYFCWVDLLNNHPPAATG